MKSGIELFCGGGVAACGIRAAGVQTVAAVEMNADIAEVYALNHPGAQVIVSPVECVDYRPFAGVDFAWASPVCKSFSVAKAGRTELTIDLTAAEAVCRMLREVRPPAFVLENVRGYQKSRAFALIRQTLGESGYWWHEDVLNSADFGVPQTRLRLIVRACLGDFPAPLPSPSRWIGWYEAIEDLIPSLPPSKFAPWQLEKSARQMPDLLGSVLTDSCVNTCREATRSVASDPSFTIRAEQMRRPITTPMTFLVESKNANQQYGDGRSPSLEPATTVVTDGRQSHMPKAFIVEGTAAGMDNKFRLPVRQEGEPIFTARGGNPQRAFLVNESSSLEVRAADVPSAAQVSAGRNDHQRAFLVDGKPQDFDGTLQIMGREDPVNTLTANQTRHPLRGWLELGRVVSMTPRALARFQSVPDSYQLPDNRKLACTVIGNGAPSRLAEAVTRSVLEAIS